MRTFIMSLTQAVGRQLNHSEVRRTAMVCWIVIPTFALLGGWALVSHLVASDNPVLRRELLVPTAAGSLVLILVWTLLGLWGLRLDREVSHSPLYTATTLWCYVLSAVSACYLIGTLNVVSGLVMMGGPMLGLILFSMRQVLLVFVAGLVLIVVLSLLSALNRIPYAPILNPEYAASAHLNLYWTLCLLLASGLYVVFQTMIMSAMVHAWHSREQDIRTLSQTDALTGVANRRHILELLDAVLLSTRRRDTPVAVLMVDIDHFKRINDDHGHLAGDRALVAAAAALRDCLRQGDLIGRYGGEEFLIILPGTLEENALEVAERCRRAIGALVIDANGVSLPLTASVGLACRACSHIHDSDHVIHLADEAMYEAKKSGRNRVVAA